MIISYLSLLLVPGCIFQRGVQAPWKDPLEDGKEPVFHIQRPEFYDYYRKQLLSQFLMHMLCTKAGNMP